jgi:ABC-type multidrug transport system ATPase subunit
MNADGAMIRFERFEKSYGKICAVEPLDLEVARGESFALVGPNGSGKTSILRAVVGLHAPTGGRILVDGFDVVRTPDRAKERLAYVPQRVSMPDLLTVYEVLQFFARLGGSPEARIEEGLDLFALGEFRDRRTLELSGGMLQRLGLAVGFLREVPLLVLDEPTVNLDPTGIERLLSLLQALKEKRTSILFSSHQLHTAMELADRVGVLVGGRIVAIDRASEFKDAVSRQTAVRIVLREIVDERTIEEEAVRAGAEEVECKGTQVWFSAPPEQRLGVIRAIEETGGVVEEFHTEAPDWQALMRAHFDAAGEERG